MGNKYILKEVFMRATIFGLCLTGSMIATTATAAGYGAAGCGLGSLVLGSKPGFMQVFAATTNGTSYSQSFGITSGTSNCIPGSKAAAFNKQREFVDTNLASLASEMAQGTGETLLAFTQTLGCEVNTAAVEKALQSGHSKIFRESRPDAVVFATHEVLKGSSEASAACKDLI